MWYKGVIRPGGQATTVMLKASLPGQLNKYSQG